MLLGRCHLLLACNSTRRGTCPHTCASLQGPLCLVWEQGKWEVLGSFALEATGGWGFVGQYLNLLAPQWAQAMLRRCLGG